MNDRENVKKKLNKYITSLNYAGKTFLLLSGANSGVSLCSFTAVIDAPVGIANTNFSLVLLIRNGIVKKSFRTMERIKNTERLFYLSGVR